MTNAESVRTALARDLPNGTPLATVLDYLDKAKVEHSGFVPKEALVGAIWRDVARNGPVTQSVKADFHFDADGKLVAMMVKDQFTGP